MGSVSAGILLHRIGDAGLEVLIVHPGGPFWARRDLGAWSIPKGEIEDGEDPLAAARREFREELGSEPPAAKPISLGEVRQRAGKRILAWSLEGDLDPAGIVSNTVEVTVRGRVIVVPEVDRAEWCSVATAREKLNPGQVPLLDRLEALLGGSEPAS